MATTRKASIAAELRADRAKFKQDLDAAKRDVKAFGDEARKAGGSFAPGGGPGGFAGFKEKVGNVIGKYQHLRQAVTDVAAAASALTGAPAMYEDMRKGLEAVTGSAEEAKSALDLVAGISEKHKLEFEPLVEAYEHMRSLGYTTQQTTDFLTEMANAVQAAGGTSSDVAAIADVMNDIKDKSAVGGAELEKLGKGFAFLRTVLKDQFGSESAADIDKLGLSMNELFDGIMRGLKRIPNAESTYSETIDPAYAASMGRLEAARRFQSFGDAGKNIPDLPERTPAPGDRDGDVKRIIDFRRRAEERAAEKEKEAAAKKAAAGREDLARQETALNIQKEIALAEGRGDEDQKAFWEDRLELVEKTADLVERLGLSEEEVTQALETQIRLRRETEAIQKRSEEARKKTEQAPGMANTREQMEIDRLRSRGRNKEADKRQRSLDVSTETERLKGEGFSPEEAAQMAETGQRTKEDQKYFEQTGRHKMRGAVSPNLGPGEFHSESVDFSKFKMKDGRSTIEGFDEATTQRKNLPGGAKGGAKPAAGGMSGKQADDILTVLREIRDATGTAGDKIQPARKD